MIPSTHDQNLLEDYEKIIDKILESNPKDLENFFQSHKQIDIMALQNKKRQTVTSKNTDLSQTFLDLAKKIIKDDKIFADWINRKDENGFVPLHFCAYTGNIKLFNLLREYGASINITDNQDQTMAHFAAQGDSIAILASLKNENFLLDAPDISGITPLYLASDSEKEESVFFLTSWNCSPNFARKDNGMTPLHASITTGNLKIIKRLISKGGDLNKKNLDNKNAKEIAQDINNSGLAQLLQRNTFLECLGAIPSIKPKRSRLKLLIFILLLAAILTGNIFLVLPYSNYQIFIYITGGILASEFIFFFLSWLKDPGTLKKRESVNILELILEHGSKDICPDCEIIMAPRSKHCEECRKCISVYDHHCPWINNCIGAKNHWIFICYIFNTEISCILLTIHSALNISDKKFGDLNLLNLSLSSETTLYIYKEIMIAITILTAGFFMIPIGALLFVQIKNLLTGFTTYERFGKMKLDRQSTLKFHLMSSKNMELGLESLLDSKKTYGERNYCNNVIDMCCLNAYNKEYNNVS